MSSKMYKLELLKLTENKITCKVLSKLKIVYLRLI